MSVGAALGSMKTGLEPFGMRQQLGQAFDRCLASLWMAYQPVVDVRNGRAYGYEALLRSEEATLPHPGAVLEAAHELGRLCELGRRVRSLATEGFAAAPHPSKLFVNLHVTDLEDPALYSPASPLTRVADQVVLELTERASLADVEDAPERVRQLRDLGFAIAIDDIGAGYSGLTSFAQLEPHIVKVDMGLVRGIHESVAKQKVVKLLVHLCHDMGTTVVAEGVETREEFEALCEIGCDLFQGFLFGRPARVPRTVHAADWAEHTSSSE